MILAVAIIQIATMVALGLLFWRHGDTRLAAAQVCYCVATGFLFLR